MASELRPVDISNIPKLLRLAKEVKESKEPRVLREDSEDLAILMPPKPARKSKRAKGRPVTEDDPLFRLIGIGKSGIPGGISGKKHEYLGRVYRPS